MFKSEGLRERGPSRLSESVTYKRRGHQAIPVRLGWWPIIAISLLLPRGDAAADGSDWWPEPELTDSSDVNEGQLQFLDPPPSTAIHLHRTRLFIDAGSREHGWTRMEQCHFNLDPVPRTGISYRPERTRDLEVVSHQGIERVWIEQGQVELQGIERGASVCVRLLSLTLEHDAAGFQLRNGPFMRRFFDGYYPLHVWLHIDYGSSGLVPVDIEPAAQPGLQVTREPGTLTLDAWFEGRLQTTVRFRPLP